MLVGDYNVTAKRKIPPEIQAITDDLQAIGCKQIDLAKAIKMDTGNLSRLLNAKTGVRLDTLGRLRRGISSLQKRIARRSELSKSGHAAVLAANQKTCDVISTAARKVFSKSVQR